MTQATLIAVRFSDPSRCYEALSRLRQADGQDSLTVNQAVVIARSTDGTLQIPDVEDNVSGGRAVAGSVIGGLIGLIGGPVGILFGVGTGALIGAATEGDDDDVAASVLAEFSRTIEPGSTALVADLVEYSPVVVDTMMSELGGVVFRRSTEVVLAEIDAADAAAEAAAREADRVLKQERKAERKERRHERRESIKDKFSSIGHKNDDKDDDQDDLAQGDAEKVSAEPKAE